MEYHQPDTYFHPVHDEYSTCHCVSLCVAARAHSCFDGGEQNRKHEASEGEGASMKDHQIRHRQL